MRRKGRPHYHVDSHGRKGYPYFRYSPVFAERLLGIICAKWVLIPKIISKMN
jgi:hypothetical protein